MKKITLEQIVCNSFTNNKVKDYYKKPQKRYTKFIDFSFHSKWMTITGIKIMISFTKPKMFWY